MGGTSLLDFALGCMKKLTKSRFGRIMHDPDISEEEKQRTLEEMASLGGYDNLPDDDNYDDDDDYWNCWD